MKKILFLFSLCFMPFLMQAQDEHFQNSSVPIEEQAIALTNAYNKHLFLNGEQTTLFQKKVAEFLISRQKAAAVLEGRNKLDKLTALSLEETREMGDILTRRQLDKYKEVKMSIQPIAVVEDDDENK